MKKALLLMLLALSLPMLASAQDMVIFKNGEVITVQVVEVSADTIKYLRVTEQEGGMGSVQKDLIQMILYHNGVKHVFADAEQEPRPQPRIGELRLRNGAVILGEKKLSDQQFKTLLSSEPRAMHAYNNSQGLTIFSTALMVGGGFLAGYELISGGNEGELNSVVLGVGLGAVVFGIILSVAGSSQFGNSIELYNKSLRKRTSGEYDLNIGFSPAGINMTWRFL